MKLSEIYKIADELAPKRLSDEYCEKYGAYDNSGVLIDVGEEITSVLFALDLTKATVEKAIKTGANLIVTHHPAIYGKIGDICVSDTLGEKLISCIKNGISLISMHLNLDAASGGIDECLMQGIQKAARTNNADGPSGEAAIMHPLTQGGYGRVYDVAKTTLEELQRQIGEEFGSKRLLVYGEDKKEIRRVASFCGAGVDEEAIRFAKSQGADLFVSSDFKHHLITAALENGLSVLVLTHYASENYGFKKYYEKIRRQISVPCGYHTEENLL